MTLFALRLDHRHHVPPTPTNEDRLRAFRAVAPVTLGNNFFRQGRNPVLPLSFAERYAAEACADAAPTTDVYTEEHA